MVQVYGEAERRELVASWECVGGNKKESPGGSSLITWLRGARFAKTPPKCNPPSLSLIITHCC